MKVTQVALRPTEASARAGRPALTPELLAASGARYSRNNEGLESILAKIDPNNLEGSVDSIFRMVDYGHQSIADMVPVAMFIDNISIWLAYYLWTLSPTAGGQESSTRYIKISIDGLISPEALGIPAKEIPEWRQLMGKCFQAYQTSLDFWEEIGNNNPMVMGIPQSLLEETSEFAKKKVARMKRNYAFDRARYFLPVTASTNVMLIMSARGWVNICQYLLSHGLPEAKRLGEMIRSELEIVAPRLLKYATHTESNQKAITQEFEKIVQMAKGQASFSEKSIFGCEGAGFPHLSVMSPDGMSQDDMARDLAYHANRYAPVGNALQRTSVRFGWSSVSFAEIRDLNRHRTGTKYCPQVPKGFYFALDQMPSEPNRQGLKEANLIQAAQIGLHASKKTLNFLQDRDPTYIYWSLLGTEYPFEHTTTADKFIYEAELRTGLGAHFRYAKHLRDVLVLWYQQFPSTKGLVLEGGAEPE